MPDEGDDEKQEQDVPHPLHIADRLGFNVASLHDADDDLGRDENKQCRAQNPDQRWLRKAQNVFKHDRLLEHESEYYL